MAKENTGNAAAITYMATVTPSINSRTTKPPDHIEPRHRRRRKRLPLWPLSTARDNRTCLLFGRMAKSTILIRALDNGSAAESVW
jgi:hypothetical protein